MTESSGDSGPPDTSVMPGAATNLTVLNHGLISRGSYDERASMLKTSLLWILGLAAIAIVITLVIDLATGSGMFLS